MESSGAWYELGFVRSRSAAPPVRRSVIALRREKSSARFAAEGLDAYGNPGTVAESPNFVAPRLRPVRATEEAKAAHEGLLKRLEDEDWVVAGVAAGAWYATMLEAPGRANRLGPGPVAGVGGLSRRLRGSVRAPRGSAA